MVNIDEPFTEREQWIEQSSNGVPRGQSPMGSLNPPPCAPSAIIVVGEQAQYMVRVSYSNKRM